MNNSQKRRFSRIKFSRRVTLQFRDNIYGPCRIKNLSLGGMFVYGDFEEGRGQICKVIFAQKGLSSELTLYISALVVRVDKDGLAIVFTSMAFDSYLYLQTSLLYEAQDPLAISQEFPEDSPFELTDDNLAHQKKKEVYQ